MMNNLPRISFGMIVLNGEPFVSYNLRALYPFAHQIIVVEGAVKSAAVNATADGHSTDATLENLRGFKADEDPDDKLIIVTKNGFWSEKNEMSQAYAEHATGDYLWQIDSDEFYLPEDMHTLIQMLQDDPTITQVAFTQYSFWGSPNYISDGWFLRRKSLFTNIHRIFKWGAGYRYTSHRPPTVINADGEAIHDKHLIDGQATQKMGIRMYHYSLVFPKQVEEKSRYYKQVDWGQFQQMDYWINHSFLTLKRPFRVHNVYRYPSWLERFRGQHPPQITALWQAVQSGTIDIQTRDNTDIEALLNNPSYIVARFIIKHADNLSEVTRPIRKFFSRQILRVKSGVHKLKSSVQGKQS